MNKVTHNGNTYYEHDGELFPEYMTDETAQFATPKRVQYGDAPIVARSGGDSPIQVPLGWMRDTMTFHTNGKVAQYQNKQGRFEIMLGLAPRSTTGF
jgi:hypothetical protein